MFEGFGKLMDEYQQLRGRKDLLESQLAGSKAEEEKLERTSRRAVEAQAIIQQIAQQTQKNLEYHISNLVSTALAAIWDNPYTFEIEFVLRRNKTECDLWFVKNGNRQEPMDSSGGGAKDVAAFALRIAYWSLKQSTDRIFILDEPFKFVSDDLQVKCSEMVHYLSQKLGLQIIMVSHLPDINFAADRTFKVMNRKGKADVGVVKA